MSEPYALKPEFEKALEAEQRKIFAYRSLNLITTAQAWAMLVAFIRPRISDARMPPSAKTQILVICNDCQLEHKMASDVKYYRCKCTPHRDRATWQHQRPLA